MVILLNFVKLLVGFLYKESFVFLLECRAEYSVLILRFIVKESDQQLHVGDSSIIILSANI